MVSGRESVKEGSNNKRKQPVGPSWVRLGTAFKELPPLAVRRVCGWNGVQAPSVLACALNPGLHPGTRRKSKSILQLVGTVSSARGFLTATGLPVTSLSCKLLANMSHTAPTVCVTMKQA